MTQTAIRTGLAVAALAALAAACATPSAPAGPAPAATAAAPAPTPGYDWFHHHHGDEASIAYGAPESDDVKLSFTCRTGSGRLEMLLTAEVDAPREIHVESGGETAVYPARSEASALHDGDYLIAEARTRDPVFQRFAEVGWIAVWEDGARNGLAPHADNAGAPAAFLAACG